MIIPSRESLAEAVKQLREERHWSLRGMCERESLSDTTLFCIEKAKRTPNFRTLGRIASIFGLRVSELIEKAEEIEEEKQKS